MEQGFYHASRGYWQTTGAVSQDIIDGYPKGTVEVSLKPSAAHEWDGSAWVEVIPDPAETLAAWREGAEISQAQARVTLYHLGLLDTVQSIADADPAASIIWEYADVIKRNSSFIDGLGAASFKPEQIDDIFIYAMALVL
jgi:hypothetical protein